MSCPIVVHTNLHGALIGCLTIADVNQLQLSILQHIENTPFLWLMIHFHWSR
jgi:hypothetical protein